MFPTYQAIEQPFIDELLRRGGGARPSDLDAQDRTVYEALADHFGLSVEDREICIFEEDGTPRSKWETTVRFARRRLIDLGRLESPRHGFWQVSERNYRRTPVSPRA